MEEELLAQTRITEYERLKALATKKFKEKKHVDAVKYFNEACSVIYTKGDTDTTRIGYYVVCKSNAAQCCFNMDDFKGAVKHATEALLKDPTNFKAMYRRGIAYEGAEKYDKAFDDLNMAKNLEPGHNDVLRALRSVATICLEHTVYEGDLDRVTLLMECGANIHLKDDEGYNAIIIASISGHTKIAEYLINKGANINEKTNDGGSCLIVASQQGHLGVVDFLISKGAKIDLKDSQGRNSLYMASQQGHVGVVDALLASSVGASWPNVNAKEFQNGLSPLGIACLSGHANVVKVLLLKGANIHETAKQNTTPLWMASQQGHADVCEVLITHGANIHDKSSPDNLSCLMTASQKGHLEAVKILVSKGANLRDRTYPINNTALMIATKLGHIDIVEFLIDNGANVHDKDKNGLRSIMMATQKGYEDIVKLLLYKGASINVKYSFDGMQMDYIEMANKKIAYVLRKWALTMVVLVFRELFVYNTLFDSLLDLYQFMGNTLN